MNSSALFNTEALLAVDSATVVRLKQLARASPTRRYRLCLHQSTAEAVQEMVVVHCRENYSRPHAHATPFSYLLIEGRMRVLFFDAAGSVTEAVELAPPGGEGAFALRVAAERWYMPVALTEQVVFFETKAGPFERDTTNRWAPWSPAEDDADAIAAFRRRLGLTTEAV